MIQEAFLKKTILKTSKVITQIVQLVSDTLGIEPNKLQYNASFSNDLGVDSLDFYELLTIVEKQFNITIDEVNAEKITTIGALIEYVEEHADTPELPAPVTPAPQPGFTLIDKSLTGLPHEKNDWQASQMP